MKKQKNLVATDNKYPIHVYFELGEDALLCPLNLTSEQVRALWSEITGEVIPADVDVSKVIKTDREWEYVASAAAERLFHYILDTKQLEKMMNEAFG